MQVLKDKEIKMPAIPEFCTHKHLWSAYCIDSKHVICMNSMLRLLTQKPNLYCSNKNNKYNNDKKNKKNRNVDDSNCCDRSGVLNELYKR